MSLQGVELRAFKSVVLGQKSCEIKDLFSANPQLMCYRLHVMSLQGVELRAFKSVVLGQKSCEIKDLFSANPQLMTVSINVNGSLKLSIIITWKYVELYQPKFMCSVPTCLKNC